MKTTSNTHMKTATVLKLISVFGFPVMILMALDKIGDIKLIGILIGVSIVIACPFCIIAWKYRAKLFSKQMSVILALSIPVGLFFWKWLGAKSSVSTVALGFILDIFLIFISFSFEDEYLK